jgi:phenylpropionate dioxygenase-like ring-hydroxylating dioxygenase large terminal subunit
MDSNIDLGLPNARYPFPAYSNGWSRAALSEDLPVGGVVPLRYFGRELVLFRTESGAARVLDAHCRHLGAHLGLGGRVDGEGIRCPFHAWRWEGDGRCSDVPYAKRVPPGALMGAWPVCERNGFVFIHYHGDGDPPGEEIPEIPECSDPEWSPFTRLRWKIRARSYDMGENAVDDVHFRYLHGAASQPKTRRGKVRGSTSNLSTMKLDTPQGQVDGSIESANVPGMGLVYVRGICDTLIVMTATPIDGEYVDQMFSYTQKVGQDPVRAKLGQALLRDLEKQMNEDIVMFEHKRYFTQPLLVPEDGPIADYRRRSRKNYSGDFSGMDLDTAARPAPAIARNDRSGEFGARECDELSSYLRSAFRVRKVERRDDTKAGRVEFRLLGREDALKHVLVFERRCLDRNEVSDLRGYLARPMVKKQIRAGGAEPFEVPSADV